MNKTRSWPKRNRQTIVFWSLFTGSIAFLCLPFMVGRLGWLSLISLVPFFLFLDFCSQRARKRQQLLFIVLIGIATMAAILFWSVQTMPERWAYIHGWAATAGLWINYALFVGLFSLQFLLFGLLFIRLKKPFAKKSSFLLLPAFWVISEFARSYVFSVFAYGHNGSIGANWNFGNLGLAVSTTYIGFAARLVGMYGLSFMAAAISLGVVWLIKRRVWWPLLITLWVAVLLSVIGATMYQPDNATKRLAFIQIPPNFEGAAARDALLNTALSKRDQGDIDVLVLPEYANIFDSQDSAHLQDSMRQLLNPDRGVVVSSRLISSDKLLSNHLQAYDARLQPVVGYDKYFLIPVGEYMPYLHQGILRAMGQTSTVKLNQEHRGTRRGSQPIPVLQLGSISLGAQVCSGAIAPTIYQQQAKTGAQVFTNSASLSMFSQAPSYQLQSHQMSRFIAIANARPFVQAAEGGHGYIIDTNGDQRAGGQALTYSFGVADIQLVKRRTLYALTGEWVVLVALLVLGGWITVSLRNRKHL